MAGKLGAELVIDIKDLDKLPVNDDEARAFVMDKVAEGVWQNIKWARQIKAEGVANATRDIPIELEERLFELT